MPTRIVNLRYIFCEIPAPQVFHKKYKWMFSSAFSIRATEKDEKYLADALPLTEPT